MPLYEYQCESCGVRFELIRKFSDPPLEACPKCGGSVRKLVSSPAFHLKGSGWYATDYARKAEKPGTAEKESGEAKPAATTDSKTGDTAAKPAEKPAAPAATPTGGKDS